MLQPGSAVGRYVVEGRIGQGGMAVVYRVRDEHGMPWALKLLSTSRDDVRERFRQEAAIQAALVHPHVVRGCELIDIDGEPGLVMEFVDGRTLDAWQLAQPEGRLPGGTADKDRIARQIVEAVAFAHSRGLVHRDLKPANVMVEDRPDGPFARVTDFGLAKVLNGYSPTRTGVPLGTPRYMAPEQIRDAKGVDARADVWSLGVLLYELYTGHPAFHGDVMLDVFTAVTKGEYVDPAEYGVPRRVRNAIRGALQVDPALRFPDCRALMAALGPAPSSPRPTVPVQPLGVLSGSDRPPPPPPSLLPPLPSMASSPPPVPDPAPVVRRPAPRGGSVSPGIRAWSAALVLVVVVFVAGLFVLVAGLFLIGGVLSVGDARQRPGQTDAGDTSRRLSSICSTLSSPSASSTSALSAFTAPNSSTPCPTPIVPTSPRFWAISATPLAAIDRPTIT